MAGFQGWQAALLRALHAPATPQNIRFLDAWQQAEGGNASYNPMNTTQSAPGASSYNSAGVKNYTSPQEGVQATAQTLLNGRYGNIVSLLRSGKARADQLGTAVAQSPWGTGSGVLRVLGSGPVPIPKTGPSSAPPSPAGVTPSSGSSPAEIVALQMLQQAQGLSQAPALGQSPQTTAAMNPSVLSNPSSLLAMAEAQRAMQPSVSLSPGGKLTVGNMTGAPEDMAAVRLAEHYIGTPYVYGGDKPGGFDCSGLLQYVWAKNGVNIPRTTYQQWGAGKPVSLSDLRPGDAVFYQGSDPEYQGGRELPGHVAMYIGNGKVIQAPHTGADVQITSLNAMGPAMGARSFTGG